MEDAGARVEVIKQEKPAFNKLPDEELQGCNKMPCAVWINCWKPSKRRWRHCRRTAAAVAWRAVAVVVVKVAKAVPTRRWWTAAVGPVETVAGDAGRRQQADGGVHETHPDLDKLAEKEKTELAGIRADQHDIEVLLEELRKANEPNGSEGDKK